MISTGVTVGEPTDLRVRAAIDSLNRMYYFDAPVAAFRRHDWRINEHWHYDINEIYEAYYRVAGVEGLSRQNAEEKAFFEELNASANIELTNQVSYRNFIYLFIMVLSKQRNSTMRDRIIRCLEGDESLQSLELTRSDTSLLLTTVTQTHRKLLQTRNFVALRDIIDQLTFDFDDLYFRELVSQPRDALRRHIEEMLAGYVRFVPHANSVVDQKIYYDLSYYKTQPMLIYGEPQKHYEMLLSDVTNPMYRGYFNSQAFERFFTDKYDNVDYSRFTARPGEKLELFGQYDDSGNDLLEGD
jgi:hypothetical protein